ncbi:MAG TPA: TRAM domain-containing protein, partial [Planctomycetota bacterium]|nr:TRAM domain-containing protein [Planctomycetota bacterium]
VQRQRFARYQGQRVRTMVESQSERDPRVLLGRTVQGMAISFEGPADRIGQMVEVRVAETSAYGMGGTLEEQDAH